MEYKASDFKILVVDDIPANILLLKIILEKEGYNVDTTDKGNDVYKIALNSKPDLILLDVMMPDMSGYEVADQLKADSQTEDISIIFITALTGSKNIINGFQHGGNDYVSKPFNKDELLIKIKHQLSLTKAKRIIEEENVKLQNTIKMRDTLYSVVAHDLRSPLGSLKMTLNMLTMLLPKDLIGEEMSDILSDANKTTEDLFGLLDNLLKWTKSLTGRLNVAFKDNDIVPVALGIKQIFDISAKQKGLEINVITPDSVVALMDIDIIITVLRNLVSNAIKYSSKDTSIDITITENKDKIIVGVKDSGIGMSQDVKNKLLNEVSITTFGTQNEEGSGLGLLLCRDFVNKNNGRFWFESEQNKGSEFFFELKKSPVNID